MSFNQVDNKPIAKRQQSTLRFLSLITLGFSPKMKLLIMIYLLVTLSSNYGVNYVNAGASPMYWRVSIILSNNTLYLPEKTDMLRMIKYFLDVKEEPIFCIEGKTFIHNQIIQSIPVKFGDSIVFLQMSKRVPSFAYARKPLPLAYAYEYDSNDEDESNPAAFSNVKVNIFPLD